MFKYYKPEDFRTLRKILNVSQDTLADMVGLTKQTVSNYENGRSFSTATAICLTLSLDPFLNDNKQAMAYASICQKIEV